MLKKNNTYLGIALGFLGPVLGLTIYYFYKFFPTFSLAEFFKVFTFQPSLITGVAILSLFANAAMLTFYLNKKRDKTAIGIFAAACIYGIAALIIKWFVLS